MDLSFAICSDLHFGPEALHKGKLRKLTAHSGRILGDIVERLNSSHRPELLVNLGDDVEDATAELDRARYRECLDILDRATADRLHVAGNHDVINITEEELRGEWDRSAGWAKEAWAATGKLYYSLDRGGVHFVVLHTRESKDRNISIEPEQLLWLERDLEAAHLPVIVLMHHPATDQHLVGNRWFEGRAHVALVQERKKLRSILERHRERKPGGILAVFNGHLHWNHLDLINGIPY